MIATLPGRVPASLTSWIVRLFVEEPAGTGWAELTGGTGPVTRLRAADLQRARRSADALRARDPDVAVILDVVVAVGRDFRSVCHLLGDPGAAGAADALRYAGTLAGLAGLISDIDRVGVADGVTLIAAAPGQDPRGIGAAVLHRLSPGTRATA